MQTTVPHLVQYQGSKRRLAPLILLFMPPTFKRLIEPFAGSAAVSLAAAFHGRTQSFVINDLNAPLIGLLQEAVERPQELAAAYTALWEAQFSYAGGSLQHYAAVRADFNQGHTAPALMLYLLARCVKGAVRYGSGGRFNQSADKRRLRTNPKTLARNALAVSQLLRHKTSFFCCDYREILNLAEPGDVVYLDPPYQGVSRTRDRCYVGGVELAEFAAALQQLEARGVDYLISYDGRCGSRSYGQDLPPALHCRKVMLQSGRSVKATLLGRTENTSEALYVSEGLWTACAGGTSSANTINS